MRAGDRRTITRIHAAYLRQIAVASQPSLLAASAGSSAEPPHGIYDRSWFYPGRSRRAAYHQQ